MTQEVRERLFLELFHAHKARIQRLCYAYLGSTAELDDLFQEVMTNVWHSLPGFRGDSKPETWLYRIAVNTALVHRRKRVRTEPLAEVAAPDAGTQQNLEDAERLAALRRAIASLPEQDRLIVTLLLEGLTYKEISDITGITVNYVGVKISRARQMLEARMQEVSHGAVR